MGAKLASLSGVLGATQDRGLSFITSTTFTAASSVSVDGCFTASYDNYRVMYAITRSATGFLNWRMRAAGVDTSSAIYSTGSRYMYPALTGGDLANNATTSWTTYNTDTSRLAASVELFAPQVAVVTTGAFSYSGRDNSAAIAVVTGGLYFNDSVQYDGFTLYPASGTITGSLSVFGYRSA